MTQGILFLLAALVFVPIAVKLGLGSVLGYLVAGIVIGPVGFALVSDPAAILHVSELGVVLMLFVIGLELEPKRLWAMRAAVFGGRLAPDQVAGMEMILTRFERRGWGDPRSLAYMLATQRVAKAWRMVRSAMKAASSRRDSVWCSIPMLSRIGRMVRQTIAWPGLNSPSVPRSLTSISTGIWLATTSEARTFGSVAKPDVCISTMPRMPAMVAPATMPMASSSRAAAMAISVPSSSNACARRCARSSGNSGVSQGTVSR